MTETLMRGDENFLVEPASPALTALPLVPSPRGARPDSPVGRTVARLAIDPQINDPIRRLEQRIGRPLIDLAGLTDQELHALTDALLRERHRRDARWYAQ